MVQRLDQPLDSAPVSVGDVGTGLERSKGYDVTIATAGVPRQ